MEMELNAGRSQALFELARKLGGTVPVGLGVLTKPERGHRMTRALQVVIEAAEAFQLIVVVCIKRFRIKRFRLNEDLLLASPSPEPKQLARVALRRLRSAFSIFWPLLGDVVARELSDGIRELAGELGPARVLDVLLQRAKPGRLRDRIQTEREAAYGWVGEVLGSGTARALMLNLVEWAHIGPLMTDPDSEETKTLPARTFAGRALRHCRRKVKAGNRT